MYVWIIVLLLVALFAAVIVASLYHSYSDPQSHHAQFRLSDVATEANGAGAVTVMVRLRYRNGASVAKLSTKATLAENVQLILGETAAATPTAWDTHARAIGEVAWTQYDVVGVSVQILVKSADRDVQTATFSKGVVLPLYRFDEL